MLCISDGLIILGITLTILGSVLNVYSSFFEKKSNFVKRYILYPGFNSKAMAAQIEHNMKSEFGIILVVLGSALQLISFVYREINISNYYFPALLCFLIPSFVLLFYIIFFKNIIVKSIDETKRLAEKELLKN